MQLLCCSNTSLTSCCHHIPFSTTEPCLRHTHSKENVLFALIIFQGLDVRCTALSIPSDEAKLYPLNKLKRL